jgi:hypothetical protein
MTRTAASTHTAKKPSAAPPVRLGAAWQRFAASAPWTDVPGRDREAALPGAAPLPAFHLGKIPIQAKLQVGPEGDGLEKEADATAERVMRMPDPSAAPGDAAGQADEDEKELRREKWEQLHPGDAGKVQRKCDACAAEEEGPLQRKAAGGAVTEKAAPAIVHDVLRSPGQPLDAGTRAFMEPRFGVDFDRVRIHTGEEAASSAQAVNALAYTVGQSIVFGRGQHAPGTAAGRRLIAHELTHVVQQGSSPPGSAGQLQRTPGDCGPAFEREFLGEINAARRDVPRQYFATIPEKNKPGKPVEALVTGTQLEVGQKGGYGGLWRAVCFKTAGMPTQILWVLGDYITNLDAKKKEEEGKKKDKEQPKKEEAPADAGEVNPLHADFELYVDLFEHVIYDEAYRIAEGGSPTNWFRVKYPNGTIVDLNINDFETSASSKETHDQLAHVKMREGHIFPKSLNKYTTPALWAAREDILEIQHWYTNKLIKLSLPAVLFVLTINPMPAGPPIEGGNVGPKLRVDRRVVPKSAPEPVAPGGALEPRSGQQGAAPSNVYQLPQRGAPQGPVGQAGSPGAYRGGPAAPELNPGAMPEPAPTSGIQPITPAPSPVAPPPVPRTAPQGGAQAPGDLFPRSTRIPAFPAQQPGGAGPWTIPGPAAPAAAAARAPRKVPVMPSGLSRADQELWRECNQLHDIYKNTQDQDAAYATRMDTIEDALQNNRASAQDRVDFCHLLDERIKLVQRMHRERQRYMDRGCDVFDWFGMGTTPAQRLKKHQDAQANVVLELANMYKLRKKFCA